MRYNVRIESEGSGENHAKVTFSETINIVMDGMLEGVVIITPIKKVKTIEESVKSKG